MRTAIALVAALAGLLAGGAAAWPAVEPLGRWLDARYDPYAHCPESPRAAALREAIVSLQGEHP